MKSRLTTLLLCAALATPALAQQPAQPPAMSAMADGEVRKIDRAQAKITLKHGEIKALDMPPMTMVFQVKDKAWLDKLQPGDKVRFSAVNEAGRYTVTAIEVQR